MTREEIVKALRACATSSITCEECPYNGQTSLCFNNLKIIAADMLEQDSKLINSTRQVEWVSVDKKLPYHRQDCRVILNGDFSQDYPATYREYGPGPGFGVYDWNDCEFEFYLNVTHWRAKPLYNVKEAKHDP